MSDTQLPTYKVIIIGASGVGKTSLANRECYNSFSPQLSPTIGTAHLTARVPLGNELVELKIWDTAGQEQFAKLVSVYARGANVCILVAAFDDEKSFTSLHLWHERLLESGEDPPVVLAINKSDTPGPLNREQFIREKYGSQYPNLFFVSAKTGDGVKELFTAAAYEAHNRARPSPEMPLVPTEKHGKDNCC